MSISPIANCLFCNIVLLEQIGNHLSRYCLWLLLYYNGRSE